MRNANAAALLGISSSAYTRFVQRLLERTGWERERCRRFVFYRYPEAVALCKLTGREPTKAAVLAELLALGTEERSER